MTPARLVLSFALLGLAAPGAAQLAEPAAITPPPLHDEAPARLRAVDALAPSLATLRGWARTLAAGEPRARRTAVAQLRALGDESLPVIRARLRELAAVGVEPKPLARALGELRRRRATGRDTAASNLADALASDATEAMRCAVELTSLADALIAQHTLAAADALIDGLLRIAPNALRPEATHARKQLGALLVPGYVRVAAESGQPALRRLAQANLSALGMPTVQRAFERIPASALPALLRVHGGLRTAEALPHVVAYVGDPRAGVHDAAVAATERFGARALPLLRVRHRSLLGLPASEALDAPTLLQLLSEHRSAADMHAAQAALPASEAALAAGRLSEAAATLDRVPRQPPESELAARIARSYVALGERQLVERRLRPALRAFRRALRHAPPSELASAARARILQVEAELRITRGVADLHALGEAAALDPSLTRATRLLDEVRGTRVAAARTRRRYAGLTAATLFVLAALMLYRDARQRRRLHAMYSQTALG